MRSVNLFPTDIPLGTNESNPFFSIHWTFTSLGSDAGEHNTLDEAAATVGARLIDHMDEVGRKWAAFILPDRPLIISSGLRGWVAIGAAEIIVSDVYKKTRIYIEREEQLLRLLRKCGDDGLPVMALVEALDKCVKDPDGTLKLRDGLMRQLNQNDSGTFPL